MLKATKLMLMSSVAALPLLGIGHLAIGQQNQTQQRKEVQEERRELQQERQQSQQQGQQKQQGQRGQQTVTGQDIAQWLIIDNRGEVQLAEFAQEQARNDQVKQFAQRIAQDHQQFVQKLQEAAGGQVSRAFRGEQQQQQQQQQKKKQQRQEVQEERRELQQERRELQQAQGSQGQSGQQGSGWLSIKQELGQQQVQSMKEALQNVEQNKFDEAFLSQQIFHHMQMLDSLKVFQKHAGSELRQVLQDGQQTTQQHLQTADQLLQQLKQQGG